MNRLYILVLLLYHTLIYGGSFFDNHHEHQDGELVSNISKKSAVTHKEKFDINNDDIENFFKNLPVTDECSNINENNNINDINNDDVKNKRRNYVRLLKQQNKTTTQLINIIKKKKYPIAILERKIFSKQNRKVVMHAISHFLYKNNQSDCNEIAMKNVKNILCLLNNKKKFKLIKNNFLEIANLNIYHDVLLNIFKYDVKNIITFLYSQNKHSFFESIQLLINKYYIDANESLHNVSVHDKEHYKYLLNILNNISSISSIDMDFLYGVNSKDGKSLEENDLTNTVNSELLSERINLYKTFNIYHLIAVLIKIANNVPNNELMNIKLKYKSFIKSLLFSDALHEFYSKYFVFLYKMLNTQSGNKNSKIIQALAEDAKKNIYVLQKYLNTIDLIEEPIKRKQSYKKNNKFMNQKIEKHKDEKKMFIIKFKNVCKKEYLKAHIINNNAEFYKLIQFN